MTFKRVEIEISHEGEGLHGAMRRLNAAGYYGVVVGNLGEVVLMYGRRVEPLNNRVPCIALIGDTLHLPDLSTGCQEHQNP